MKILNALSGIVITIILSGLLIVTISSKVRTTRSDFITPAQTVTNTLTHTLPSLSSPIKVSNLTRFTGVNGQICYPSFAPKGDKFLCYVLIDNSPQLWLASSTSGFERVLLDKQYVNFIWSDDSQNIIYSLQPESPDLAPVRPIFLMNINSKKVTELGQSISIGNLQSLPQNKVAFVKENNLQVVQVEANLKITSQTLIPAIIDKQMFVPNSKDNSSEENNIPTYYNLTFEISPDGQNVLLFETIDLRTSLTWLNVKSKKEQVIFEQAELVQKPFSWSSDSTKFVYSVVDYETGLPELRVMGVKDSKSSLLWRGLEPGWYDYITWLPNRDTIFFGYVPTGTYPSERSVYQTINVNDRIPQELLINGMGFEVSNDGYRITFNREIVDGQFDPSAWVATLSN